MSETSIPAPQESLYSPAEQSMRQETAAWIAGESVGTVGMRTSLDLNPSELAGIQQRHIDRGGMGEIANRSGYQERGDIAILPSDFVQNNNEQTIAFTSKGDRTTVAYHFQSDAMKDDTGRPGNNLFMSMDLPKVRAEELELLLSVNPMLAEDIVTAQMKGLGFSDEKIKQSLTPQYDPSDERSSDPSLRTLKIYSRQDETKTWDEVTPEDVEYKTALPIALAVDDMVAHRKPEEITSGADKQAEIPTFDEMIARGVGSLVLGPELKTVVAVVSPAENTSSPTTPPTPAASPAPATAPQPNPNVQPSMLTIPHSINGRLIRVEDYVPIVVTPYSVGTGLTNDKVEKKREQELVNFHARQEAMVDQENEKRAADIQAERERRSRLPLDEQILESKMDVLATNLEQIYRVGKEIGSSKSDIQRKREDIVTELVREYATDFKNAMSDADLHPTDERPKEKNALSYLIGPYQYKLDAPYAQTIYGVSTLEWAPIIDDTSGKRKNVYEPVWVVHTLSTTEPEEVHPSMTTGPNYQDSGLAIDKDGTLYNCHLDRLHKVAPVTLNAKDVDGKVLAVDEFELLSSSLLLDKVGNGPDGRDYYNIARTLCTDILAAKHQILKAYGKA